MCEGWWEQGRRVQEALVARCARQACIPLSLTLPWPLSVTVRRHLCQLTTCCDRLSPSVSPVRSRHAALGKR